MGGWGVRAGAVAAAFALAGCDLGRVEVAFEDLPAQEILVQALIAMDELDSVTMSGSDSFGSERGTYEVTLEEGGDCRIDIEVGTMGGRAQLINVDGNTYLRGNKRFWTAVSEERADERLPAEAIDHWVATPDSGAIAELCDLDEILDEIARDIDADFDPTDVSRIVHAEYDGRRAVQVNTQNPRIAAVVATGPEHHFLTFDAAGSGAVDFSGFNEPVDVQAPPADEVVDWSGSAGV